MLLRRTTASTFLRHARQWQFARGQHAASALEAFSGEELYEPAYSEPPKGTQAHRTDTFVREVTPFSGNEDCSLHSLYCVSNLQASSHAVKMPGRVRCMRTLASMSQANKIVPLDRPNQGTSQ